MIARLVARSMFAVTAFLFLTAGCCNGVPPDAVEGAWQLTRTVRSQSVGCRQLATSTLEIHIGRPGDAPLLVSTLDALEVRQQDITDSTASFVLLEMPFDDTRQLLIGHDLAIDDLDRLVGTARASGDGDDLGCDYTLDVVGVRR